MTQLRIMRLRDESETAPFNAQFFPQHVVLLGVGDNIMPMGYWTVVSKEPFRFLICVEVSNYTLGLLREVKEAALHFMPWSERERVVRAGYLSGRDVNKVDELGFDQMPAEKLEHTQLVQGADAVFETILYQELEGYSGQFGLFMLDVVAAH